VPPRKKTAAAPPLTDADVKELAFRVKGGDSPRVIVRSASAAVPAGTRGNVIRIGNPSEGEYIVVRLGRDQVPFAPNELSLSTRGRPTGTAAGAAPAKSAPAARTATKKTAAASSRPSRSSARSTTKAAAKPARSGPAKSSQAKAAKAAPAKTTATQRTAALAKEVAKAAPARPAAAKRSSARSARRGKGRSPQPLTVTMRFSDSRWTIEAQRGSRRLAKAQPLRPGAVSAFAEHVDEAAVREALVETVESCRSVVEEKAAALRAELDAAEAALREYDARRR
jgi:hypothetical protein